MLIDCGMGTEACFQAFARAMEGLNLEWPSIRQILLTHIHPDHMGLARKLLDLSGARLLLHGQDLELLAGITAFDKNRIWHRDVLAGAGVPPEIVSQITGSFSDIHKNFHMLQPDWTLRGGETIQAEIGVLEVLWTPGHSPGHVCLYCRDRRILFAGDHMLQHITPNIGWQPGRDALGEFLSSLDQMAQLEVDLILPSHGAPFTGHREWVRNTTEHHAERCRLILAELSTGPKTAHDLVGKLWNRPLTPFHYRFAIFEVLAHLEYLQRRGQSRAQPQNGVVYWS
jgi:glyoxylase-like metal-dependent hydrolase (beta-lactamase superfamily II)